MSCKVRDIIAATSVTTGIDRSLLEDGNFRWGDISRARHAAMYLAKRHTGHSFTRIGQLFGGFDHKAVSYGCRNIALKLAARDRDIILLVNRIEKRARQ